MEISNQAILADMIINARNEKRYSQRHLSTITGISNTEISKIERAERIKPQPHILKKISEALDMDYEEMMEAIGYIETPEFDDNRNTLSADEKDFIVEAIVEKYKKSSSDLNPEFDNKGTIYDMLFTAQNSVKTIIDLPVGMQEKIDKILKNSTQAQISKFMSLCDWFIDNELTL